MSEVPTLDVVTERIAQQYERLNRRLTRWHTGEDPLHHMNVATFRGLLEAGVILPGPAVTGEIEEIGRQS